MPAPSHNASQRSTLPPILHGLSQRELEAAARGSLSRFSPVKWRMIRIADAMVTPLVRAVDSRAPRSDSGAKRIDKILVVEYGQLGDVAMVLPFLKNLRLHYPEAHIVLAGNPRHLALLESENLVDELVAVDAPWCVIQSRWTKHIPFSGLWRRLAQVTRALRKEKFDLAINPRGDIRDNWFLWGTRARIRLGYAIYGGRCFLTDVAAPDIEHPHYTNRWLHLLEHLGKPILDTRPLLKLTPADHEGAARFLATRQWGEENFRAVGQRLATQFSAKILWFEEPHSTAATGSGFVRVALPLREFAAVLARCNVVVCNDSGPMHVAAALGARVVAIFGPNIPACYGPIGDQNRTVIREGFWCRPCADRCIFDQPYCLRTIPVEEVVQAAAELLAPNVAQPVQAGA